MTARSSSAWTPTPEPMPSPSLPAQPVSCSTSASSQLRLLAWHAHRAGGDLEARRVIEGVGTYGARLARAATEAGYETVEAPRMNARANRGVGKSDPLDARRIAQAALPLLDTQLRRPRSDD